MRDRRVHLEVAADAGQLTVVVTQGGKQKTFHYMVEPNSYRFQYFFPLGHVGPQDGWVEFSDVRFA